MTKEQQIVRNAFDAHIRELKAISTKEDKEVFDMLEEVKNKAINALQKPTMDKAMIRTLAKENDELQAEIGRLRQALEQSTSDDCISREKVKEFVNYIQSVKDKHNEEGAPINYGTICDLVIRGWKLLDSPSVIPVHGTCEKCKWLATDEDGNYYCKLTGYFYSLDYYCADFEKRGSDNGMDRNGL